MDPENGRRVVCIFKSEKAARASGKLIKSWAYFFAVADIRHQLFVRSEGFCERCGEPVTELSGEIHEKIHRGKGGEISLANSEFICNKAHRREHRDRNPRFKRIIPQDKG